MDVVMQSVSEAVDGGTSSLSPLLDNSCPPRSLLTSSPIILHPSLSFPPAKNVAASVTSGANAKKRQLEQYTVEATSNDPITTYYGVKQAVSAVLYLFLDRPLTFVPSFLPRRPTMPSGLESVARRC